MFPFLLEGAILELGFALSVVISWLLLAGSNPMALEADICRIRTNLTNTINTSCDLKESPNPQRADRKIAEQ